MPVERIPVTDRASWLRLRTQDLTASDIAAVAGADPSRTPLRVWAEKTGRIPPTDDNDIMRRGRWLEAAVIEALLDERPTWELRRAGVYLRDPEIRMGATPDAVAIDPAREGIGNVQCKVVSRPVFEREWDVDEDTGVVTAPLKFQVQTLAESMLLDAAWSVVAALVIDTYTASLRIADVPRHPAAEARIRDTVDGFWRIVADGGEPAPVYAKDGGVISALYPAELPGIVVDLSGDNRIQDLLARRDRHKRFIKLAGARVEEAEAEIKAKLGEAVEAKVPGWKVTWKSQTRREHVVAETTFRALRITDKRHKGDAR